MISISDLAEVIRDNIHPGEEGPLGDLWLDCAGAVFAAIASSVPIDTYAGLIRNGTPGKSTIVSDPKVSIPMPDGAVPPPCSFSDVETNTRIRPPVLVDIKAVLWFRCISHFACP